MVGNEVLHKKLGNNFGISGPRWIIKNVIVNTLKQKSDENNWQQKKMYHGIHAIRHGTF